MTSYDEERGRERVRFHPIHYLRVASHFWPWERAFWLALFHDSVEDGWATNEGLCMVFGVSFASDMSALTRHETHETYAHYISEIALSPKDVRRVKRADLAENYARAPSSLRRRYAKAMEVLA